MDTQNVANPIRHAVAALNHASVVSRAFDAQLFPDLSENYTECRARTTGADVWQ
jgi:hypothetical protein